MKQLKAATKCQEIDNYISDYQEKKISAMKKNIIEYKKCSDKKILEIQNEYDKKINEAEKIVNGKIIDLQEKYDKGKEQYNKMCFRYNEKKKEYDKLLELPSHSVISDFRNMGKDNLLGGGKSFSKEELNTLLEDIQRIETQYDFYSRNKDIIEQLNNQHALEIRGKDNKISRLTESIDLLEQKNIELQMYANYVNDSNKIIDFNNYKSNFVIVETQNYGYGNKNTDWGTYSQKEIISIEDYQRRKKEKEKINIVENENNNVLEM